MTEFFAAFFREAAGQPLATFLCLLGVAAALWWLLKERPASIKERKTQAQVQHEDSVAIAGHIGCSNEVIRHSSAVIENSTKVIENSMRTQELLQNAVVALGQEVASVRDAVEENNHMLTEVLTIVKHRPN